MSKIAEALAKAKERTGHTTAPFMSGVPVVSPEAAAKKEAALRRARRLQRFWLVLSSVALVLTLIIIWMRLDEAKGAKDAQPTAADAVAVQPAAGAPVAKPSDPSRVELMNETPAAVVLPAESGDGAAAVAPPRIELQAEVDALVLTAVLPGERPRLMYKGRIVGVGAQVEGELVFAGLHDGRLVFNDARGAIYLRRY